MLSIFNSIFNSTFISTFINIKAETPLNSPDPAFKKKLLHILDFLSSLPT